MIDNYVDAHIGERITILSSGGEIWVSANEVDVEEFKLDPRIWLQFPKSMQQHGVLITLSEAKDLALALIDQVQYLWEVKDNG